ncbi:unnamed protein product [Parascedosporium putredinis]|uniref:Something about silencing protein 4 domain-containing protein n=1 Tax=Parascedosporium putredinis TaxID=1442378 RepID=A0A9P1HB04_9PEZI|nr:unnamed protein product [Parascedosporium putredinis]CAI8003398.1 unnamed protein product [Parascedosporium putredinis]
MATLSRSSRRPEDNALHHHHHIVGRPTATHHHLMATSAARANTAAAALATQTKISSLEARADASSGPSMRPIATPMISQEKVRNGIQHELDRLQPASADAKPEGRKLRSQETIRFKSELSTYFPEYDEVIGNDPKQSHLLNLETPIIIVESAHPLLETSETAKTNARKRPLKEQASHDTGSLTDNLNIVQHYGDALFDDLYDSQRIDFGFLEARLKKKLPEDPLLDTYYEPTHKKAERTEKSIRNRERGVPSMSVIASSGCLMASKAMTGLGSWAILDKFRRWTLEEKRRKLDRERKEAEQSEPQPASGMLRSGSSAPRAEDEPSGAGDDASVVSDPNSDVDASIAKQLQEEALARAQASSETKQPAKRLRGKAAAAKPTTASTSKTSAARKPAEPVATKPPKEFTSFFKKKHERDAALSRGRRSGRKILAWGLPLPDMPEAEFDLLTISKISRVLIRAA